MTVLWTDEEVRLAQQLRAVGISKPAIAARLNQVFHKGQNIRTFEGVDKKLRTLEKASIPDVVESTEPEALIEVFTGTADVPADVQVQVSGYNLKTWDLTCTALRKATEGLHDITLQGPIHYPSEPGFTGTITFWKPTVKDQTQAAHVAAEVLKDAGFKVSMIGV